MRRSSRLLKDPNQLAAEVARLSTEEPREEIREYLAKLEEKVA